MDAEHPSRIGRYEILDELGRGTASAVYLARDTVLDRLVALKTLRSGAGDPEGLAAVHQDLVREAQSASRLAHPNVITIYDIVEGDEAGTFYIAMEYVRGPTLAERLTWEKQLSTDEVLSTVGQIAAALDHLHARGLVHRDIKPANILITEDGTVKISDFGIARRAEPELRSEPDVQGTPMYMSPEQIQGLVLDGRSDVFSLGVLLYELLTRRKPFPGETVREVTHRIVYEAYIPPETFADDVTPEVSQVLGRALAKDPARRHPTAGQLAADLAGALGRPRPDVPTGPDTPTQRLPRQPWRGIGEPYTAGQETLLPARGRHRTALVLVVLLAALLGALAAWLVIPGEPRPADRPGGLTEGSPGLAYRALLDEGRGLLADDPEAAAMLFTVAEGLADDPGEARELRREAEELAAQQGVADRYAEARQALDERRLGDAVAGARDRLASKGGHDTALDILAEVELGLEEEEGGQAPAREAAAAGAGDGAPGTATLTVGLDSETPRGVITIYAGRNQVLREPFAFYERKGFFRREPTSGSLEREIQVPPGSYPLKIFLARRGEAAQLVTVEGSFEGGARRRLSVSLPARGEPLARLR